MFNLLILLVISSNLEYTKSSLFKINDELKVVNNQRIEVLPEAFEMALIWTVEGFLKLEAELNRPVYETENGIHFVLSTNPITIKLTKEEITQEDGCPYGQGRCAGIWLPNQRRIMLRLKENQCLGDTRLVHELIHALLHDYDHDVDYKKTKLPVAKDYPGEHPSDFFFVDNSLEESINNKLREYYCQ